MNIVIYVTLAVIIIGTIYHNVCLTKENDKLREEIARDFYEQMRKETIKPKRISVRFLKVENVGDNTTFNATVQEWEKQGYRYNAEKSIESVLAFEKWVFEDEEKEGKA